MIVSHLLLILHKKYSFISLCLKPEMWQKVAKFKWAEYFRKALYILPVWPCPGVSSDGATVSPDPSYLSLQYLCCSSLCVGGLGSVCHIWCTSPVLSGVMCEFKCALSNSLFLSFSRRT